MSRSPCTFKSLRSQIPRDRWRTLRKPVFAAAGNRCEVCGGIGDDWPVECDEVWQYDEERSVARLIGLRALCPSCHEVKHLGHTVVVGGERAGHRARAHLMVVNGWDGPTADVHIQAAWALWRRRNQHEWSIDFGRWASAVAGETRRAR